MGHMRLSKSAICSGASSRNSGITSMFWIETTIAITIARYTAKRASRCAGVKRRQVLASSVAAVTFALSLFIHLAALEENRAHPSRKHLTNKDQKNDREQHRAHEIVVEALECSEQRTADAAGADDPDHGRIAQIGIELVGR